jgi:hypothetical protein
VWTLYKISLRSSNGAKALAPRTCAMCGCMHRTCTRTRFQGFCW